MLFRSVQKWRYWDARHDLQGLLEAPPAQTRWRHLYNDRMAMDKHALDTFNKALSTEQYRVSRMEDISSKGYDVKDLLLRLLNETPDDAEDVLARRYYAKATLGMLHRAVALGKWSRLQKRQMVGLEEVSSGPTLISSMVEDSREPLRALSTI